jgi:hypothetical protein
MESTEPADSERASALSERERPWLPVPGKGVYLGRQYSCSDKGGWLVIRDVHPDLRFRVQRQSRVDRLAARIGFAVPIVTGDAAFDRETLVAADQAAGAKLLADSKVRRLVAALVELGDLQLGSGGLRLKLRRRGRLADRAERLRSAIDPLVELVDVLEKVGFASRSEPRREALGIVAKLIFVYALFLLVRVAIDGTILLSHASVKQSGWDTLRWCGPVVLLVLLARARWAAGKPDAGGRLLTWCLTVPFFCGVLGWAGLVAADRWIGSSTSRIVEVLVLKSSPSKEAADITVSSWDSVGETETLRASREFGERLQPGITRINVELARGWLGYERRTQVGVASKGRPQNQGDQATAAGSRPSVLSKKELLLVLAACVSVVPAFITLLWFLSIRIRLRPKDAALLGAKARFLTVRGQRRGIDFSLWDGWVRVPSPLPVRLSVRRRDDARGWLAQRRKLPTVPQDRDQFDRELVIESTPPEVAAALVAVPEARQILIELLTLPGERRVVLLDPKRLKAPCRFFRQKTPEVSLTIDRIVALHEILATRIGPAMKSAAKVLER